MTNGVIALMRHGKTQWNIEGKLQGRKNSPLLLGSKPVAEQIAQYLLRAGAPTKVYCSPLPRCIQTAQIVCGVLDIPYEASDDLMECSMGECEGLTWQEAEERFPSFMAERERKKWTTPWPGGESYQDVLARADQFHKKLSQRESERPLIIGHEMFNKCFLGFCLDYEPEQIMALSQANQELFLIDSRHKTFQTVRFDASSQLQQ